MSPKEKKELKESLIKQLIKEEDSNDVINYFNTMSIEELQELLEYKFLIFFKNSEKQNLNNEN